jgi:Mg-chelatase subunit ChlD
MNKNLTELVLVLDRSGSMSATKDDAEGGLREFVRKQRREPGEAVMTFYRFDNVIDQVFEEKNLKSVEDNDLALDPRGGTALLDAIGQAVNEVGTRLSKKDESNRPGKVIVLVVTDGQENASHEFTRERIFEMITTQKNKFNWDIIFVGADQDAIATGGSYGISFQASLNSSGKSHRNAYSALGYAVSRSRTTGDAVSFTTTERNLAMTKDKV